MSGDLAPHGLSIANRGADNATLLYDGKPMLKLGTMPESQTFAFSWGSTYLRHKEWLDWMARHGLGVYAKRASEADLAGPEACAYAEQSWILLQFFGRIEDYADLRLVSEMVAKAPTGPGTGAAGQMRHPSRHRVVRLKVYQND